MDNPIDRKYTKEHEWIKIDGETVILGITNFAQDQLMTAEEYDKFLTGIE